MQKFSRLKKLKNCKSLLGSYTFFCLYYVLCDLTNHILYLLFKLKVFFTKKSYFTCFSAVRVRPLCLGFSFPCCGFSFRGYLCLPPAIRISPCIFPKLSMKILVKKKIVFRNIVDVSHKETLIYSLSQY